MTHAVAQAQDPEVQNRIERLNRVSKSRAFSEAEVAAALRGETIEPDGDDVGTILCL